MRTEVNIFFTLLFICSFIVSVAFTNEKNGNSYKVSGEFDVNMESPIISAASPTNNLIETNETVASPSSGTSSMHGKNGEFEVYHEYVNIKAINITQKYPPLPTRFFHSNERTVLYKINEQMSHDLLNKIGYFTTYLALERHYLERNSSR